MSDTLSRSSSWRIKVVRRGHETAWVPHICTPPSSQASSPRTVHFPVKPAATPVPPSLMRRISAPDDVPTVPLPMPIPLRTKSETSARTRPVRTQRQHSGSSISSTSSAESQTLVTPPASPRHGPAAAWADMAPCYASWDPSLADATELDVHDCTHASGSDEPPRIRLVDVLPESFTAPDLPFQWLNPSPAARHLRDPRSVPIDPCDTDFGPLSPPRTPLLRSVALPYGPDVCDRANRFEREPRSKSRKHRRPDTPRPLGPRTTTALGLLDLDGSIDQQAATSWEHVGDRTREHLDYAHDSPQRRRIM